MEVFPDNTLHYMITHLLSRMEVDKDQVKGGCWKNGYFEIESWKFLTLLGTISDYFTNEEDLLDDRGFPIYLLKPHGKELIWWLVIFIIFFYQVESWKAKKGEVCEKLCLNLIPPFHPLTIPPSHLSPQSQKQTNPNQTMNRKEKISYALSLSTNLYFLKLDGKYKKKKKKKFILKMRIGEMRERWEMGVDQKWKKGG